MAAGHPRLTLPRADRHKAAPPKPRRGGPHGEQHTPTHQAKVPARAARAQLHQGWHPLCLSVAQEVGPSAPRQVPPQEPQTEQIKEKHKVTFKTAKREQRSCSGPSRVRWAAALLARRQPLTEGSLRRRRRRAWRGATRLGTAPLGRRRPWPHVWMPLCPEGRAASCGRWPCTKGPERGTGPARPAHGGRTEALLPSRTVTSTPLPFLPWQPPHPQ